MSRLLESAVARATEGGIARALEAEAAAFAPTDITGLKLWLDASQLALADNADVYTWSDMSGLGNDVTARVGVDNPPTFKTGIQNGLPVIRFNRADSELLFRTASVGTVAHVFAVAKYNGATFINYDAMIGGTSELLLIGNLGSTVMYPAPNTPTYYYNGADSTATRQGPMNAFVVLGLSVATPHTAIAPIVGNDRFITDRYWHGDMCEIIFYDHVLTTGERGQVDAYLQTKWGIT
jgi:hypothetical protein